MSASITTLPTSLTTGASQAAGETREGARTRLRLTRRGRIFFGTLLTLAFTAAFAMIAIFGGAKAVASAESIDSDFGYVVVQPGASLWEVASELDANADPRDLVAEIVRLNQLSDSGVQAGQPVAVPLRYSEAPGVSSGAELGL